MAHCRKELGPEDYENIMNFQSPDEMSEAIELMQKEARETSISRLLRHFKSRVQQLKTFTFAITLVVGLESPQTACVWGVMTLMLEVSKHTLRQAHEQTQKFGSSQFVLTRLWKKSLLCGRTLATVYRYSKYTGTS